ncbi:unnamed protein product [Ilex paraguariensis]|uniref:Uncharacterized protein n=1 Tax=Ilex paraguariensis TaxID=185542 RepID=A0ABC8QUN0_9AQUA
MGTKVEEDVNVNDYGDRNIEDTITSHVLRMNSYRRRDIDQLIEPMGALFDAIFMHRSPIHMNVVSTHTDKIDECGHQEEIQLLSEKVNHLKLISEQGVENDKLKEQMELGKSKRDAATQVDM